MLPILLNFLVSCGFGSLFFFSLLARENLSLDDPAIARIMLIAAAATMATSYLAGWLSDRVGRKAFITCGFALGAVSYWLIYTSAGAAGLMLGRVMFGAAFGMYTGALASYISDSGKALGKFYMAASALGSACGLVVVGIFGKHISNEEAFFIGSFFFLVSAVFAFALPTTVGAGAARASLWPVALLRRNFMIYLCALLRHSGAASLWVLWSLYLRELGADNSTVGFITATNFITQFLVAYYVVDHVRSLRAVSRGLLLSAAALLSFYFVPSAWWLLGPQVVLGFSWILFYTGSLKALEEMNPADKGAAIGMMNAVIHFSSILGPAITEWASRRWSSLDFRARFHIEILIAAGITLAGWVLWQLWLSVSARRGAAVEAPNAS